MNFPAMVMRQDRDNSGFGSELTAQIKRARNWMRVENMLKYHDKYTPYHIQKAKMIWNKRL